MGRYGIFVFGLLALVIVAGAFYAVSGSGGGGSFSSWFREHEDWFILPPPSGSSSPKTIATTPTSIGDSSAKPKPTAPAPKPVPKPAPKPAPVPEPKPTPPPGFTAAQLSPYYQKARLSGVSLIRNRGDVGGFTVSLDSSLTKPVNVTGWTLRSNKSVVVARVPQAVANYGAGTAGDIMAAPGDYVVVRTSKSPIGNLRTNRCTGFLNGVYELDQSLPGDCPALYSREELSPLSGKCQSYIGGFGGCRMPKSEDYAAVGNLDGGQCRAFLDRFGYQNCYSTYFMTPDFFYHEWRAWIDVSTLGMDPDHDRILLLDQNGLLVDLYIY